MARRLERSQREEVLRSPTLTDVARAAGVSYATADRVLNKRGGVSERAVTKVNEAVVSLDYVRNVAAANLSQNRAYTFVFLLPDGQNAFFKSVRSIIAERAAHLAKSKVIIEVREVRAFSANALAEQIEQLSGHVVDGVAIVGLDADTLGPGLARLKEAEVPVISLVSDLPRDQRTAYIGIDNGAAGRTAARMLGLAHGGRPGQVQVVVGDLAARDHQDRLDGFLDVLRRDFPGVNALSPIEGRDDAKMVEAAMNDVLAWDDQPTAIYSIGAGNSGLIRALEAHAHRPLVAVHELVAGSRAALESNLIHFVIDQRPEEEIDAALGLLRALVDKVQPPPHKPIIPTIYVRDNLPPFNFNDRA